MEIAEVKTALGKRVRFKDERLSVDADYIFTGCIIRRSDRGRFFYQAEIQDIKNKNSICIVDLEKITREEKK